MKDLSQAQPFTITFSLCNDSPRAFKEEVGPIVFINDRHTRFTREINLLSLFEIKYVYPSICGGHEFWLTTGQDRRAVTEFEEVKIEGDLLIIDFVSDQKLDFYIQLSNPKSQRFAHQEIEVVPNSRPVFMEDLADIKITMFEGKPFRNLDDRILFYKSPKAFDFENQEIKMTFSGLESIASMVRTQQKYAE